MRRLSGLAQRVTHSASSVAVNAEADCEMLRTVGNPLWVLVRR
jgi:hypothetical protein